MPVLLLENAFLEKARRTQPLKDVFRIVAKKQKLSESYKVKVSHKTLPVWRVEGLFHDIIYVLMLDGLMITRSQ